MISVYLHFEVLIHVFVQVYSIFPGTELNRAANAILHLSMGRRRGFILVFKIFQCLVLISLLELFYFLSSCNYCGDRCGIGREKYLKCTECKWIIYLFGTFHLLPQERDTVKAPTISLIGWPIAIHRNSTLLISGWIPTFWWLCSRLLHFCPAPSANNCQIPLKLFLSLQIFYCDLQPVVYPRKLPYSMNYTNSRFELKAQAYDILLYM